MPFMTEILEIYSIKNEDEYTVALLRVSGLMDKPTQHLDDSIDGFELELLTRLIQKYEKERSIMPR